MPSLKSICKLDAGGAAMSTLTLTGLAVVSPTITGVPREVFIILALAAAFFAWHSSRCYRTGATGAMVVRIGLLNLAYGVVSLGILWTFRETIKPLGAAYFWFELILVVPLALYEVKRGRSGS